ncbi:MSMEG_0568 family radical SAM protein [Teredinibacter turnerae]|uniref:MSMEG_0568 family radical SAM protein n=1 Tax=Teredinibacter turnerae TaxID=2426 RepID=UPI000365B488|nr:MSMEG_0568 family radical SAM protein [Teredinibacter turnerae]
MISPQLLTRIQAQGVRWGGAGLGLNRTGGAGPTDHKALDFGSQTSMVPVFEQPLVELQTEAKPVARSPFRAEPQSDAQVLIFEDDKPVARVQAPARPRFYDLTTADGVPYWKIATLHSKDVLATTVLQTCVRYRNRETSCQFCAIEESLAAGKTIAHKTPQQLAEVARAAVTLDGVQQMILTTGTPKGGDRGAAVLEASARAIKAAVDIPLQAQCEPPDDDSWFQRLKDAGVDALGMHLEAVSERVRKQIMPGKASVPLSRYLAAYDAAVAVFGAGNVSTYILAGLGDTEEEILTFSLDLVARGVYPFVVPFVPVAGTPLENAPMADPAMLDRIFQTLGPALRARGIASDSLSAGCAKCGACSALKSYESQNQESENQEEQADAKAAVCV